VASGNRLTRARMEKDVKRVMMTMMIWQVAQMMSS